MTRQEERKAIFRAVNEASKTTDNRHDCAIVAARIADRRGVNVSSAPYREDLFIEALDRKFTS